MRNIPCSVGTLTFNSGATLRRALESVQDVDDIVVCDGGSTDDTLDIARSFGARVISQDVRCMYENGGIKDFACAKNQLIEAARYPYLLILDSDEAASPDLMRELTRIARTGTEDGYRIPIRMWWRGRVIEHAANYPGYQYRIVRTDCGVRMIKPVHERPQFTHCLDEKATTLDAPWYVFLDDNFVHRYMERNGKYLRREFEALGRISFRWWLASIVRRNVRNILAIALKTAWYRVRYPGAVHMPLTVELGRIRYHSALISGALKHVCRI